MITIVKCPICEKQVSWIKENQFRPFCCERCKLVDLGEWADEKRKIFNSSTVEKWNKLEDENEF